MGGRWERVEGNSQRVSTGGCRCQQFWSHCSLPYRIFTRASVKTTNELDDYNVYIYLLLD